MSLSAYPFCHGKSSGPVSDARLDAFLKALAQLGWRDGENVRLEIRRGAGDADAMRKYAAELAALAPDVLMAIGGTATGQLLQASGLKRSTSIWTTGFCTRESGPLV